MKGDRISILKGAMDLLILKALSWGPMHGYGVSYWIRQVTEQAFELQEGVLYPALHRLENKGWIESEWGTSENNRRAKFYTLTKIGRKQLRMGTICRSCRQGRAGHRQTRLGFEVGPGWRWRGRDCYDTNVAALPDAGASRYSA